MMAPKCLLLVGLALAGCLLLEVSANDIPVKFCVKNCNGQPVGGKTVRISGCVDYSSDGGPVDSPLYNCVTGGINSETPGCCTLPKAVQYCKGDAKNLCAWEVLGGGYTASIATFVDVNAGSITPKQLSGCQCSGPPEVCADPFYPSPPNDIITFTQTASDCPKPCPTTCAVHLDKETLPGTCSSALEGGSAHECPGEYFNTNEPCKSGQPDCGVCCVKRTEQRLCRDPTVKAGPCEGAECICFENEKGASCQKVDPPFPYIKDEIGVGGGCAENLCNALAAKQGKHAACCPYKCDNGPKKP